MFWEIYFDKSKTDFTNHNVSLFVNSKRKPTEKQALKFAKKFNVGSDYNLRYIAPSVFKMDDEITDYIDLEKKDTDE